MKQVGPGEFEFTDDELRLRSQHEGFLDAGYGLHEAVEKMLLSVPIDSADWSLLNDSEFRSYLQTEHHACRVNDLVFQGSMGAPGYGIVLKCPFCSIEWVAAGSVYYRADGTGLEEDAEPPWMLSIGDVR